MSFELIVVGNTSTQFTFSLGIYGVSAVRQLNFALILIGNEGFGAIEAVSRSKYTLTEMTPSIFTTALIILTLPTSHTQPQSQLPHS